MNKINDSSSKYIYFIKSCFTSFLYAAGTTKMFCYDHAFIHFFIELILLNSNLCPCWLIDINIYFVFLFIYVSMLSKLRKQNIRGPGDRPVEAL